MQSKLKKSQICQGINEFTLNTQLINTYVPQAGDVGLFKVIHADSGVIMDEQGVSRRIFEGDVIMAAFGNRYATSQIEGYVPSTPVQECQLLGRGGVVGLVKSLNATVGREPVQLELLGYATAANGRVINTIQYHQLKPFHPANIRTKVILSIGTSMDSGKTTTAAYLCGGLKNAGHSVAYIKLTGTAFPKDARFCVDRGADLGIDFAHFGFPSTFMADETTLLNLYQSLVDEAMQACNPDYIVMEIADGILQRETSLLLNHSDFMSTIDRVIFSCGDSLGVLSGLQILQNWGIHPFALCGLFTASELLINEVQEVTNLPVLRLPELLEGERIAGLLTSTWYETLTAVA